MKCCVYLIYMHNIVYYQSNMTCFTVLIMNLHTQMSYILYFFKMSILQTIKGQCRLEGIVINFFTRHKPVLSQNNK